jgi:hypothetical protein
VSELGRLTEETFVGWKVAPDQPVQAPAIPIGNPPTDDAGHAIYLIDRPGAVQATVVLGEPGIQQTDPDACALDVLGSAMNGLGGVQPLVSRAVSGSAPNCTSLAQALRFCSSGGLLLSHYLLLVVFGIIPFRIACHHSMS